MTGKRRTTTSKRTSTMTKIFTRTTSTTTTTKAILTMTTGGTARRTTEQRQTKTDRNHKSENSEKRKNVRSKSTSISDFFVSALSPTSCFSGSSCTRGSTTFPWACCAAGCPRTRCGTIPKGTRRCHTQPSHQSSHCCNSSILVRSDRSACQAPALRTAAAPGWTPAQPPPDFATPSPDASCSIPSACRRGPAWLACLSRRPPGHGLSLGVRRRPLAPPARIVGRIGRPCASSPSAPPPAT
mmetsp:Transcript_13068/g.33796  ORF Transcript_13068/g.33796 Transcript_13068/m.33796 type:complete len:241 (-) Transcript_13068:455-1177(-)